MAKSAYAQYLKQAKQNWKNIKEEAKSELGNTNVPAGTYVAKLVGLELVEIREKCYLSRKFLIIEGGHKGAYIKDLLNFTHEIGGKITYKFLVMSGVDEEFDIEDIEEIIPELMKECFKYKIKLTYYNDYPNILTLSLLDENDSDEDEDEDKEIESDHEEEEEEEDEEDEEEEDEDEEDLSKYSKQELLEVVKQNNLTFEDLGYKNKLSMKKASKDNLLKKLESIIADNDDDEEDIGDDNDDIDELKEFCGTQDIEFSGEDSKESLLKKIKAEKYEEDDLDEPEKDVLKKYNLEKLIIKKTKKNKKSIKLKKK